MAGGTSESTATRCTEALLSGTLYEVRGFAACQKCTKSELKTRKNWKLEVVQRYIFYKFDTC